MKITLIEPEPPGFHVFSHFKLPRLGLPLLGAILRNQGHQVRIHIDFLGQKYTSQFDDSDLVGISTTTSTAPEAYRLGDLFRRRGRTVVIGGVHASFMPEEALMHADYVVRGEAEKSFPELIRCIRAGLPPTDVPGVSYRLSDQFIHNPKGPLLDDLDGLPFPDFSLLTRPLGKVDVPIQTSRGCPYPCNFCSVTQMFGRKVRFRSVDHVIAELKQIPRPEVFFYDDNFCARPAYTKELLERMIRENIRLDYFSAQVRADMTRDLEVMDLATRAGCKQVYVGFESVNPASLKEYDKRQTVDEIAASMEVFKRYKIRVHGMFVIGSDHDTAGTAKQTLRFARKHGIDTVQFMMLTPLPGTEYFRQLETEGRIVCRDWSLYDAHHAVFMPRQMSPVRLQKTTIRAMSRFYSCTDGLKNLAALKLWQASRAFMGWYLIRRWKWDNRDWTTRLVGLYLKAKRAELERKLKGLRVPLEEALERAKSGLPDVPAKAQEIRRQGERLLEEIRGMKAELVSALEKDLAAIEKRVEELTTTAMRLLDELHGLSGGAMA
jgi:radical SAM superfamily enzyme YgiQ (UPF0313 family)